MDELVEATRKEKYIVITEEQLQELLNATQVIEEHDTMVSDKIRLLRYNDYLFVQEKSDKGEYLLRGFESELEARQFIMDRMKIYEDMWDGCGCKVYYYD
ncbi:hypothetical protein DRI50_00065 [candidate division KSB1 bacterium]|jgi:hypothetical protein|nr:MAG: hypothetical protein DRI50_00065 [candidate division KSB1 bacterium]